MMRRISPIGSADPYQLRLEESLRSDWRLYGEALVMAGCEPPWAGTELLPVAPLRVAACG